MILFDAKVKVYIILLNLYTLPLKKIALNHLLHMNKQKCDEMLTAKHGWFGP